MVSFLFDFKVYNFMEANFFKGFKLFEDSFKKQMGAIMGIHPEDVGEDYLDEFIIANPVIITKDGNKYKLKGNIRFKVVYRGKNIVIIRDISYPDPKHDKLADFPHGINASPDAGKEYMLTKDKYRELIQWRMPPTGPEMGA